MHKSVLLKASLIGLLCCGFSANAQLTPEVREEFDNLISDAIFFTDRYITPATDAAVYQAASSWVNTPKKSELWDFTLSAHINTFFVPKSDRKFTISNSDFQFFTIDGATSAQTPTALGSDKYVTLTGTLNSEPVVIKSPEGVNRDAVVYPFLQGSLGLPYGTEFVARFSPRTTLKNVEYQVFGFGLKHNLSQYFKNLSAKKIHLSALAAYSQEDISVAFLDVQTSFGNLGFNSLNSLIDTWQFQLNASKEFGKFELSTGFIVNTSDFEYKVDGNKGAIEQYIPLQDILNYNLRSIAKTKTNYIGEIAGRYQLSQIYLQTSVAFGKFVNSNVSVQYEF